MIKQTADKYHPYAGLPELKFPGNQVSFMDNPSDEECFQLWDKYSMLDNIREHSLEVARIAGSLAMRAKEIGKNISSDACRASALLHDIAKTYCLKYGGSHAVLGACWALQETGNYLLAQGVLLHVTWPWPLPDLSEICSLPILVLYADKRVRHSKCVTLEQRFDYILEHYGKTIEARNNVFESREKAFKIEQLLSEALEWNLLNEDSFDCRRLVK